MARRHARDPRQARQLGCSGRSSTRRTWRPRWPATLAFVFLLNPGTGPVNSILGKPGAAPAGLVQRPAPGRSPRWRCWRVWGVGDLMVIFMAALLDVPTRAVRGGRAGRRRCVAPVPPRDAAAPAADPRCSRSITGVIAMMQYYTEPIVAGQVASGQIGGSGQQFEPGYPDGSTLTLPQLVYNLGFQRFDIGAACVIALVLFVLSMVFAAFLMRRGSGFLGAED